MNPCEGSDPVVFSTFAVCANTAYFAVFFLYVLVHLFVLHTGQFPSDLCSCLRVLLPAQICYWNPLVKFLVLLLHFSNQEFLCSLSINSVSWCSLFSGTLFSWFPSALGAYLRPLTWSPYLVSLCFLRDGSGWFLLWISQTFLFLCMLCDVVLKTAGFEYYHVLTRNRILSPPRSLFS